MLMKSLLHELGDTSVMFQLSSEQEKRLKELLLAMCIDVMTFCENNGLICMLGGGTALGAIRHKGFIPWDDDIDLNMPRDDYYRFLPMFSEVYKEKYVVYWPDGNGRAAALFAKVSIQGTIMEEVFHSDTGIELGVSLDIFPMDNVPDNTIIASFKGLISNILRGAVVSADYYQSRSKKMRSAFSGNWKAKLIYNARCIVGFLMSWKSYQWWFTVYDRFVQTKGKTKRFTVPTGRMGYFGEMMNWNDVFPLKKAIFEGCKFNVCGNVEEYLRKLYGDYMQLPPIEKREKHFYTKVQF